MSQYLLAKDTINGKQGKAIATINGQNKTLFHLKKLQADVEYQKADVKVVGTTTVQSKVTGAVKRGTMTVYSGTPVFTEIATEYEKNGKVTYFDMQVENDDPSVSIGKKITALYGCSLDKIPLCLLDSDADTLEEEVGFSFTSFEVLQDFTDPTTLG